MLSTQQLEALTAAVDVAYDGDPERAEMEDSARKALDYLKASVNSPKPNGSRWAVVTGSRRFNDALNRIRRIIKIDPNYKAVVMPEVDYEKLRNRLLLLEEFYTYYSSKNDELYVPTVRLVDESEIGGPDGAT